MRYKIRKVIPNCMNSRNSYLDFTYINLNNYFDDYFSLIGITSMSLEGIVP